MIGHDEMSGSSHLFRSEEIIEKFSDKRLHDYLSYLLEINRDLNLVSRETSPSSLLSLAADSLIPLAFGVELSGRFFDIGPGGGFPSVPLLLADADLSAILIERTRKKALFLRGASEKFGIEADIIPGDFVESVGSMDGSGFSFGTMKYVRLERRVLDGVRRILDTDGKFLYYSRLDDAQNEFLSDYNIKSYRYYLDRTDRLRTLSVFSLKQS